MRPNSKKILVSSEDIIQKTNELALSRLHVGLTLRQIQLLSFCIYYTQQSGESIFSKAEVEEKFNLPRYKTKDAFDDADRLTDLKIKIKDFENDSFELTNVIPDMKYLKGKFIFQWNPVLVQHIINLQDKYIRTDLTVAAKFNSSFSWILYDHLKAHYNYWHLPVSKKELLKLFGVEGKDGYSSNTALFRKYVLDPAISEVNEHTEYEVWYHVMKEGRSITGFDIHWSTGKYIDQATRKQIQTIKSRLDFIDERTMEFMNLDEKEDRIRAIEVIERSKKLRNFATEPICITKEYADKIIKDLKFNLNELNRLLEKNNRPSVPFYNWLESEE